MLKFTSNVIFLIILATFFIVLFLNYHLNLGYTKEDFSGFSNGKTDYKGETGLKLLIPDNNVYYDPSNANVIIIDSTMVKVLTGTTTSYTVYDMKVLANVEAINKLPQTISPNRKTYCYEVVKDEQYLVYIPTSNNTFINVINVKSDDYFKKNTKPITVNKTELKSIMAESDTMDFKSLDNSDKLFMPNPMCVVNIDGDNIIVMVPLNNEVKTFDKNDKTNILNFIKKYKPADFMDKIKNEGVCSLIEIIPQQKYLFYLARGQAFCLNVIDVNRSVNAILTAKYNELDNYASNAKELFQVKIPTICPMLSAILLNWYQNIRVINGNFTPWGGIDGTGDPKNEKRFGNSGAAAADLMPILLSDINKPSDFGIYEEQILLNGDKDGSKTMNLKTPNITLLESLNKLATTKGWKTK